LIDRIDEGFSKMVELIYQSKGRLIVSGIGKSGIIGQKIVATLNSTGTRSFFLHPVEALHGDLGIVSKNDIFLALSNSGETELNDLVPIIRQIGCGVIAFTGGLDSTLAKLSDIVIDVGVEKEACPLGLTPTASTTAVLAMGDAMAMALLSKRQFKPSDFKKFHPGGSLGQRLASKVSDIMMTGDKVPTVPAGRAMKAVLARINLFNLGIVFIIDEAGGLKGIITDGDIRRMLSWSESIHALPADEVMIENPKTVNPNTPVYDALNIMEQHEITALPVVEGEKKVAGIIHLHDILGKGAFKFNGK
jgi:arabinose-5-phosphate isomerase